jgi:hypothetical protein
MAFIVKYRLNGREVSRSEFRKNRRHKRRERRGIPAAHVGLRPSQTLVSEGAAVHPQDAAQAEENAKRAGVPTHFDSDGRPHFNSFRHQREYLRTVGMHNKRDIE